MQKERIKVLFVIGTRPEAIKLAPLIRAFQSDGAFEPAVCLSGQHGALAREVLDLFDIRPQYNITLDTAGKTLSSKSALLMQVLEGVIGQARPGWIFVQGDTLTTFCAALAGFYAGIPVAHVEAGLRANGPGGPFPEEAHRKAVADLATLHFAPTAGARENLLREAVPERRIFVTGNTGIDALMQISKRAAGAAAAYAGQFEALAGFPLDGSKKIVTATFHRWENRAEKLEEILAALVAIAGLDSALAVFPAHPNPAVQQAIGPYRQGPVRFIPPLPYALFVWLLQQSFLIITDSGGIQEEAATLGVPLILVRDTTERQEALVSGNLQLVGTERGAIAEGVAALWDGGGQYQRMAQARPLFGDGTASERILGFFKGYLGLAEG
ncbi:MAG: UDP-N-acetylglucosamine 2-epimerase (non-hydrolyzing) [Lewinellaceae bacterium]|nr:UDP-N-acetylglucosamine 2-epimerase (non-hydrolyzing) [Lewinellaceae bacterium]